MKDKVDAAKAACVAVTVMTALLTILGLLFCWACPDWIPMAHHRFWMHFFATTLGILLFSFMLKVGWRTCLRAAPIAAVAWLALWGIAQLAPSVNGVRQFAVIGPLRVDVMAFLPLVAGLSLAWIANRFCLRTRTWVVMAVALMGLVMLLMAASSPTVMEELGIFITGEASQDDVRLLAARMEHLEALTSSRWFSSSDGDVKNILGCFTYGLPSSAARLFGRWFIVVAICLLLGLFAVPMVCCWRRPASCSKRAFVLVAGGLIFAYPAIIGPLQCLNIVPLLNVCWPLVSCRMTSVLTEWMVAGILVVLLHSEAEPEGGHGSYCSGNEIL